MMTMTMLSQSRKLRQAGNEEGAIFSAQEEKTQAKGGIHTAAHIHVCTNAINMNPICISPSLRCPFPPFHNHYPLCDRPNRTATETKAAAPAAETQSLGGRRRPIYLMMNAVNGAL